MRRRNLVIGIGAAAAVTAGALGVAASTGRSSAADVAARPPVTVRASTQDLVRTLDVTGTLVFTDQRTIAYLRDTATTATGTSTGGTSTPTGAPSSPSSSGSAGATSSASGASAAGAANRTSTPTTAGVATGGSSDQVASGGTASTTAGASAAAGGSTVGGSTTGSSTTGSGNRSASSNATSQAAASAPTATTPTTTTSSTGAATGAPAATGGGGSGAPGSGGARHTLTWIPALGSTIDRNQVLFRVDDAPTYLFIGSQPAFRQLDLNATPGPDIRQLEENLVALGFGDGVTVDDTYDAGTAYAVARWETSVGLDGDGVVQLGKVAFAPTAGRLTDEPVAVGAIVGTGTALVTVTATSASVTAPVDSRQVGAVHVGQPATIHRPDGTTTPGTVSSVGTTATSSGGTATAPSDPTPSTMSVTMTPDDPAALSGLPGGTQLPATIELERRSRVLAVPTGALLAGADGRPVVVVAASGRQEPVTPGLATNGFVELTTPGPITDGTELVVTP